MVKVVLEAGGTLILRVLRHYDQTICVVVLVLFDLELVAERTDLASPSLAAPRSSCD